MAVGGISVCDGAAWVPALRGDAFSERAAAENAPPTGHPRFERGAEGCVVKHLPHPAFCQ